MQIYYPSYYLVPITPIMFSNEDEYNSAYSVAYGTRYNDECYRDVHSNNRDSKYNIEASEIYNIYRTINQDIFYAVDEEYVNDILK